MICSGFLSHCRSRLPTWSLTDIGVVHEDLFLPSLCTNLRNPSSLFFFISSGRVNLFLKINIFVPLPPVEIVSISLLPVVLHSWDPGTLLREKLQVAVSNCDPTGAARSSRGRGGPDPAALLEAGFVRFWCREFGSCGVESNPDRHRWMGVAPSTPYLHGRDALDIYMEQDRIRQYTTADGMEVPAHKRLSEADAKALPHIII